MNVLSHVPCRPWRHLLAAASLSVLACGSPPPPTGATPIGGADGSVADAGRPDGGTADGGGSPMDLAPPSPYRTPFPPPMPQVLPGSGSVLASPAVVPVFFPADSLQMNLVSFLQVYLGRSAAWQVMREYGVGVGTVASPVVLNQPLGATLSDAGVQALVSAQVQGGALPRPGAATLYLLYFPATVTITFGSATGCKDFAGYHNTAQLADGTRYAYAVMPRCSRLLGSLTATTSHELAEATTDPVLTANNQLAAPYGIWQFNLHGAEVADLCENLSDPAFTESGVGVVSRVYSNAAATLRRNPCLPAPAGAAFFSVPILTELLPVSINGVRQDLESVAVRAGGSQSIEVRLLSDARPSPTFGVTAQEGPLPAAMGGMAAPVLTLSWAEAPGRPAATGADGATLHLQIAAAAGAPAGYTTVRLTSTGPTAAGTQTQTQWVAAVRVLAP